MFAIIDGIAPAIVNCEEYVGRPFLIALVLIWSWNWCKGGSRGRAVEWDMFIIEDLPPES